MKFSRDHRHLLRFLDRMGTPISLTMLPEGRSITGLKMLADNGYITIAVMITEKGRKAID